MQSTTQLTAAPDYPVSGSSLPLYTHADVRQGSPVSRAWRTITRFCDENYEELRDTLNWPATIEQINALQHGLGQTLPQAVCEWLLCCDGQEVESYASCKDGLFFGLPFLGTHDILREWRFWRHVDKNPETGQNPVLKAHMHSCPTQWVRCEYSCPGWIPLIADGNGNYLGVDLSPDPAGPGKAGQVILFGRDFDTKIVVYGCDGPDGWAKFLQSFAEELEAGTTYVMHAADEVDSGASEDQVGYKSYFAGAGDRGGEAGIEFQLVGEYARWPVLECWAERSFRAWRMLGLAEEHRDSSFTSDSLLPEHIGDISKSSSTDDPMDPLHSNSHSKASHKSASSVRIATPPKQPQSYRTKKDDGSYCEESPSIRRTAMPAPQPLVDLPTIEDVRAVEAVNMTQSSRASSVLNPIRNLTSNSLYLNIKGSNSVLPLHDTVEMVPQPSNEQLPQHSGDEAADAIHASWKGTHGMRSTAQLLDSDTNPDGASADLVDAPKSDV
ncbi:Cell wall assembly regulator [Malassezia caprae]|uniref:Cell wall assembly regulator n=1 Tax=Malassezia caprae TaxID=1381934 RepID=A0AAF0E7S0_9BASI|nr:Cell wall assembly regulator [Malassezia caprae]